MDNQKILDFNPWWLKKDINISEKNLPKRFIFDELKKLTKKDIIISISGLRRMGKTTILRQLIAEDLDNKALDPKNIFFYQFSESDNDLGAVLNYYFKNVQQDLVSQISPHIYLDELQYLRNWPEVLKYYYDLNKKIKFVITGSASLYYQLKVDESLLGRIVDLSLPPLSFSEFLYLNSQKKLGELPDLFADRQELWQKLNERNLLLDKDKFFNYLLNGEFPQVVFEKENLFIRKYLENSVLDKIFNKDILLFEVEKQAEIRKLFKSLGQSIAQGVNKADLSRQLSLSRPAVSKYIEVLKQSFLIREANNFLRSIRSQEKSFKRVYFTSLNLAAAVLSINDYKDMLYPDFTGHVIENYVFNSLSRLYKDNIYFWSVNKKEVDIVVNQGQRILPIEIKLKKEIKLRDLNHLLYFMDRKKIDWAWLVYGGELKQKKINGKEIWFVPYWIF